MQLAELLRGVTGPQRPAPAERRRAMSHPRQVRLAGSVLDRSRHVCAFFHRKEEEYQVLLPFIKEGFEQGQHPVLVEVAVPQLGLLPAPDLQLPLPLGFGHVDARFLQTPQKLRAVPRIDHVEGAVALVESLLDEREKYPVLLLLVVEEGADMPGAVED